VTEEHSVNGGLGEACSRVFLEAGLSPAFKLVAIPDEHTVTGSQEEILNHYGVSPDGLKDAMKSLLEVG
jgi:transketolase